MSRTDAPRPRAALYARTSRAGQHIDAQLTKLRRVAKQRGWTVVAEFVDDEVSSRRKTRPEFERLLKAAHGGEIDLVAAVALDRYARSVRELLDLMEKLSGLGVDLVSLREQIETCSAVGKIIFTVLAAISEFERDLIRERTLAGLDEARRRGKTLGRPTAGVDPGDVAEPASASCQSSDPMIMMFVASASKSKSVSMRESRSSLKTSTPMTKRVLR